MITKNDVKHVIEQYKTAREVNKWCESMLDTDLYHDDEFMRHYSSMYAMFRAYEVAVVAAVYNHVDQVCDEAYHLLSEDDGWTKYPVRYKRTKRAVKLIVSPALEGTLCHIWCSDDSNSEYIAIDHDVREVHIPIESNRWVLRLHAYGDEYGSCDYAKSQVCKNDRTIDDILFAAFERNNIKREIERACEEYKARITELYEPILCLPYNDFRDITKHANASF